MTDPREPFYRAEEAFRDSVRFLLASLSDAELEQLDLLFNPQNLDDVPLRHQSVGAKVRAAINVEQRRRISDIPENA